MGIHNLTASNVQWLVRLQWCKWYHQWDQCVPWMGILRTECKKTSQIHKYILKYIYVLKKVHTELDKQSKNMCYHNPRSYLWIRTSHSQTHGDQCLQQRYSYWIKALSSENSLCVHSKLKDVVSLLTNLCIKYLSHKLFALKQVLKICTICLPLGVSFLSVKFQYN